MKANYNPFFKRASESFESDQIFIKLFSYDILSVFFKNNINQLWNTINIIRSSPGGGKTTLLRLFTPSVLKSIIDNRNQDDIKQLYKILEDYNIVSNEAPLVSGSIISFIDEYTELEYLDANELRKTHLFYSLLNSRITISILRSICQTFELSFPKELNKISLKKTDSLPVGISDLKFGSDLIDWAYKIEENICDEIDSLVSDNASLSGHDSLFTLKVFTADNILIDNESVDFRTLLMFDDVHNLSSNLRQKLMKHIVDLRPNINIWLSERLQALTMSEIFSDGQVEGRDIFIIDLEGYWRKEYKKFEKFSKSVADKRVMTASDNELTSFDGCLSENFSEITISSIDTAVETLGSEFEELKNTTRYTEWINSKENLIIGDYEKLIEWRSLKILIKRDQKKLQRSFNFFDLTEEELKNQEGSDIKNAALIFLNKEYKIPYYYGFSIFSRLGSFNIEQFLSISGEIYELIVSKYFTSNYFSKNRNLTVSPEEQEKIVTKAANSKLKEITRRIPNSVEVMKFIDSIGNFSQDETYLENAPISPGVNGIAILMEDRNYLFELIKKNELGLYSNLAKVISTCISYNLLEVRLNYRCKGNDWMVLYLNRLLCVKYKLPLNYGGFKEKKLKDLISWVNHGYSAKKSINLWT
jgi:hypothetical protein